MCSFIHVCILLCVCVSRSVCVCVSGRPLKYPADSNQIPVDVSSQQTDQ